MTLLSQLTEIERIFLILRKLSKQDWANFLKFVFVGTCALSSKYTIFLSRKMQRRDSLGETTKIPRLSTRNTRRFKSRRNQSSISSISDISACEAAS